MKNKNLILITLFVATSLFACKKKELDINSDTYFGIQEFLTSKNCKVNCQTKASCEGKTLKLKGSLDEMNINEDVSQFWLIDERKDKYTISVDVDTLITIEVFTKIKEYGGKSIKIKGIAEGYDKQTNFSCDRVFVIKLSSVDDIIL